MAPESLESICIKTGESHMHLDHFLAPPDPRKAPFYQKACMRWKTDMFCILCTPPPMVAAIEMYFLAYFDLL